MARTYLHCETGAYINLDHISRFFVNHDFSRDKATMEVNVVGLTYPQTVMEFDDETKAKNTLRDLIARLEA